MRRRDFMLGWLLATVAPSVRAQESAKQHRIAIITPAGPVADLSDTGPRAWPAFFDELRRLGDVEGQNLTVERYSGEGRPERYADLAHEVVNRNPDVIGKCLRTAASGNQPTFGNLAGWNAAR
jgi:putative tryptophan/tyrosine transport system substrate-binding protein